LQMAKDIAPSPFPSPLRLSHWQRGGGEDEKGLRTRLNNVFAAEHFGAYTCLEATFHNTELMKTSYLNP
jgi:hypothetical protein